MNKSLKCILVLILFVIVLFSAFYFIPLSQESFTKYQYKNMADKMLNSLKESGFSEAHYRWGNNDSEYIDICFDQTDMGYLSFSTDNILNLDLSDKKNDIPKILDIILPIWNNKFCNGDGEIIYKKLLNSRKLNYDGSVNNGQIYYNDYVFMEMLPIDSIDEPIEYIVIMHK